MKRVVLLDANVLYASTLRDTLVQLAIDGVYEARWTNQIHEEWMRNVLKNRPDLLPAKLENTRDLMDFHVPRALVEGYEPLIETLTLPDENDRHVLAAAIHSRAELILTFNLKDFPARILSVYGIKALPSDPFLCELLTANPTEVTAALQTQRIRMKRPPQTSAQFFETLARQGLPRFTAALEAFQAQL